ncbi:hypothetical protein ACIQVT_25875 [Streptomyces sp. NPDC100445]|uniref:hypothetical protein n=1 Tax=Streptomyces sp. NPDC100445 TaxID=3366102 RepID=UPI0038155704
MGSDANAARITAKVRGRDITLEGGLSKDEVRRRVWWWTPDAAEQGEDGGHAYDDDREDVITTLGGYYRVPGDPDSPEAGDLVDMVHSELNPDG